MEIVKFLVGVILLLLAQVVWFLYWQISYKISDKDLEPIGCRGIPIVLAGVGLIVIGTYLMIGYDKPVPMRFATYFFTFLLIEIAVAAFVPLVWNFFTNPVIISKPREGGKIKTFIYTVIQLILIGVIIWLIWIIGRIGYE